jgi:hypothetical protein
LIYTAIRELCATISLREREGGERERGEKIKFKLCKIILMGNYFFEILYVGN